MQSALSMKLSIGALLPCQMPRHQVLAETPAARAWRTDTKQRSNAPSLKSGVLAGCACAFSTSLASCHRRGETQRRSRQRLRAEAVYEKTWSNPTGEVLKPLATDLWVAERPFVWLGIDVGGKMAIVRLPSGGLWVHSPVELDEPLRLALAALGPVEEVVSPNYEHVKWAKQWEEAYPEATLWGSPGMIKKYPKIPYSKELSALNKVPESWGGVLDMAYFGCEKLPVLGEPLFNEVNFFHKPSKTLICTDTYWSWPAKGIPEGTLAFKWAMDTLYLPLYKSVLVTDKAAYESALARIESWKAEALLPCHGVFQTQGATATFMSHMLSEEGAR